MTAAERLINYAKVHTTSDEDSGKHPSTERQRDLAELLYDELRSMGINAYYDKDNCYVYAKLPASAGYENRKTVGFIAHLDTSPEASGENVS
ncbi:MAG: peptidase T, partial [Oscillospiraceae bacterium]|nr:peptidase T [Oscillospiraceae bacterium]